MNQYAVLLITTPTRQEAENLTKRLLQQKLAACVNLLPVASHYRWKGKIEEAEEILMLVKTQRRLINQIVKLVERHHSYEVPEVIALPLIEGNPKYLQWIAESVKPGEKKSG